MRSMPAEVMTRMPLASNQLLIIAAGHRAHHARHHAVAHLDDRQLARRASTAPP